jgi:hypothetical protein
MATRRAPLRFESQRLWGDPETRNVRKAFSTIKKCADVTMCVAAAGFILAVYINSRDLREAMTWLETVGIVASVLFGGQDLYARLDAMEDRLNARLDAHDARFEAIDRRFDTVDESLRAIAQRFDAIDKRFELIDQRFDAM